MASRIRRHFPMVRFRDDQKLLFNPVQKSVLADRPEERVRLRMIEFLVREAGFSLNRMSTEIGIKSFTTDSSLRTDILCFDELHRPLLLVECKSESVKLDEIAAVQIARYNRTVKAPYIFLTNGLRDILFAVREDDSVDLIPELDTVFPLISDENRDLTYWIDRNLWGKNSSVESDESLSAYLNEFWSSEISDTQYFTIQIPADLTEMAEVEPKISTFFKVFPRNEDRSRSAISIFGNIFGKTFILLITSNPASSPCWIIFQVETDKSGLILQKGVLKNRDEKSLKIPDNLHIDFSKTSTDHSDQILLCELSDFIPK